MFGRFVCGISCLSLQGFHWSVCKRHCPLALRRVLLRPRSHGYEEDWSDWELKGNWKWKDLGSETERRLQAFLEDAMPPRPVGRRVNGLRYRTWIDTCEMNKIEHFNTKLSKCGSNDLCKAYNHWNFVENTGNTFSKYPFITNWRAHFWHNVRLLVLQC